MHFHRIVKPNSLFHAGCVLAIGNMEGVHLGHAALLKVAHALADAGGHSASVLTFYPHPHTYFKPDLKPLSLMRPAAKIEALWNHGINEVIMLHFDRELAEMSAADFVSQMCIEKFKARHIVTGANFHFGKNREGNASILADMMRSHGLGYSCVEPVTTDDGNPVSSTRIRNALKQGDMQTARQLLGKIYTISGRVMHGDKRGKTIGFPTANLSLPEIFLPKFGVYAVKAKLRGNILEGVANLGIRPSVSNTGRANLEVHLFDFDEQIYGERLEVQLLHFIREEQKFSHSQLMIDQLQQDVLKSKALFAETSS